MKRAPHNLNLIRRGWARVDALAERVRSGEIRRPDPTRTARWLAGELPGEQGEGAMGQAYVPVRLPDAVVERVDALVDRLATEDAGQALGRLSRSSVLRLAIVRGLDVLESEHERGAKPKRAGKG